MKVSKGDVAGGALVVGFIVGLMVLVVAISTPNTDALNQLTNYLQNHGYRIHHTIDPIGCNQNPVIVSSWEAFVSDINPNNTVIWYYDNVNWPAAAQLNADSCIEVWF